MTDTPIELDKHRGMAAQKATELRRILAEVENHAKELRDRQVPLDHRLTQDLDREQDDGDVETGVAPGREQHRDLATAEAYIATARVGPALPPWILSGKQATVKPDGGSASRLCSFSMWQ